LKPLDLTTSNEGAPNAKRFAILAVHPKTAGSNAQHRFYIFCHGLAGAQAKREATALLG